MRMGNHLYTSMLSRFSYGMSLDVDDSFNSALVNSSLHPMTCKNGHGVIQWGIGKAYALSGPSPAGTLWTARCRNIFQRGKLLTKMFDVAGL
jgi:hypothetical protein